MAADKRITEKGMDIGREVIVSLALVVNSILSSTDHMRLADTCRSVSRKDEHSGSDVQSFEVDDNAGKALVDIDQHAARCTGKAQAIGPDGSSLEQLP